MGKIFAHHLFDKALISKIYKELIQLNSKKINNPILKMGKGPESTFFQRRYMNGQQVHEKMLNSLVIREMQIKTAMKYHLTMAIIKGRMWRKGNTCAPLMGVCKLVYPLWKTVWRFLKKLKIELPYGPAILLLGIYPEKTKTLI